MSCNRSKSLGAGFQLASHDLDIRGAGNLRGEEQSGHITEVGFELYQAMLEEAVAALKDGAEEYEDTNEWSPQISLGMPVMIPEHYVPDLQVRMQLYRQLGDLKDAREIDAAGAELIDRFGPLPDEVEALLKVILVKSLCRAANVEKVEAGPKGAVVTLQQQRISQSGGTGPDEYPTRAWRCGSSRTRSWCSCASGRTRRRDSRAPRRFSAAWPSSPKTARIPHRKSPAPEQTNAGTLGRFG